MNNSDLRKAGLKVTSPRVKILDIYGQLKQMNQDVGLATVYRVLTQFEAADLVTKHNFEGGHSVYELSQGEHHDHLVCVKCAKIVEFVDDLIESRQEQIAKEAGFEITDHSLNIYGICPICQNK